MRIPGFWQVFAHLWICSTLSRGNSSADSDSTAMSSSFQEQDYCPYEKFSPSCKIGQVLIIHSALYGRMKIGHCIKTNFGFIGCSVDVLSVLDKTCSGRRSCSIEVGNPSFGAAIPCNTDLMNYLHVAYSCVEVPNIDLTTCSLTMDGGRAEMIPGGSLHTAPCGSTSRPLRVEVPLGQRINMTLLDFDPSMRGASPAGDGDRPPTTPEHHVDTPPLCIRYGVVFDGDLVGDSEAEGRVADHRIRSGEGRDICKANVRESLVISSSSRALSIQFSAERGSNFALIFTAVGCPQLTPPPHAVVKQDGDSAEVRCTNSKTTRVWHLVCKGSSWVGSTIGNCTHPGKGGGRTSKPGGHSFLSFSLSSAWTSLVALGVAIIIGLVILVIGLFCWRRYLLRRKERKPRSHTTENTPMYQIAGSQNMDASDAELDLLGEQQRSQCVYCRAANDHYAPFRDPEKATILPRSTIYSGSRTLERPVMPPDLYSCNVKNADEDERIKIMSDLNVAYDRLPQTLPTTRKPSAVSTITAPKSSTKNRDHRVLSDI